MSKEVTLNDLQASAVDAIVQLKNECMHRANVIAELQERNAALEKELGELKLAGGE